MIGQIDKKYLKVRPFKLWARMIAYFWFEGRPLTTKGRWINVFVLFFFKIFKKLPSLKKVKQPIYILGTGRSGTTILGVIMSMHKSVGFLNEPKAIWYSVYKNEDIIGSYSSSAGSYQLSSIDATPKLKKELNNIYNTYLRFSFSKRLVDKYPELIFRMPFLLEIYPDAKCIFLVRNGWDTISSIDLWSKRIGLQKNGDTHNWWGLNNRKWNCLKEQILKNDSYFNSVLPYLDELDNHTDYAALEWIATMRKGQECALKFPDNILKIKFEDLTSNVSTTLNQITKFTNLKEDYVFMDYATETLRPVKARDSVEIHHSIKQIFHKTMVSLGYD